MTLATEPITPLHLVAAQGEQPTSLAGRQAWSGLAYRVESYRDRHPEALGHEAGGGVMAAIDPRPVGRWLPAREWEGLAGQLACATDLVSLAAEARAPGGTALLGDVSSWLERVDHAGAAVAARDAAAVDRGLSLNDGLGLGW